MSETITRHCAMDTRTLSALGVGLMAAANNIGPSARARPTTMPGTSAPSAAVHLTLVEEVRVSLHRSSSACAPDQPELVSSV